MQIENDNTQAKEYSRKANYLNSLKQKLNLKQLLILGYKSKGVTNAEIARELGIHYHTVAYTWKQLKASDLWQEIEKAYHSLIPLWLLSVQSNLKKGKEWTQSDFGKSIGLFVKEAPTLQVNLNKIEQAVLVNENVAKLYGQEAIIDATRDDVQVSSTQENAPPVQANTQIEQKQEGGVSPPTPVDDLIISSPSILQKQSSESANTKSNNDYRVAITDIDYIPMLAEPVVDVGIEVVSVDVSRETVLEIRAKRKCIRRRRMRRSRRRND